MADLKAIFGEDQKHELIVSTHHMCALMLFNNADRLSYKEIEQAAEIPASDLKKCLKSMACVKGKNILGKKQRMKEGQEEIAEDWLEKFIEKLSRHDVVFPIIFFGHIEVSPSGSRKWIEGEVMQALAYDVPILGYKTKKTISLRLWEAKTGAEDFNLFQFNDGQYEAVCHRHRAPILDTPLQPGLEIGYFFVVEYHDEVFVKCQETVGRVCRTMPKDDSPQNLPLFESLKQKNSRNSPYELLKNSIRILEKCEQAMECSSSFFRTCSQILAHLIVVTSARMT
uniref:Cullin family profile domain-containing protein n=1 Tax=Vitis vinifera TaxID=29760 RepID=A5AS27_VITVI|nr:hypothetical protein VITISV_036692 [Vitis vinifera]